MNRFKALREQGLRTGMLAGLIVCFLVPVSLWGQDEPAGLMLTWQNDPTTTMVVHWHAAPEVHSDSTIRIREATEQQWQSVVARSHTIPLVKKTIYRKELSGLKPGTRYAFRLGDFDRVYYFETMPADISREPIVFAVGGNTLDQNFRDGKMCMERVTNLIARYNPRFVLWSGHWPDDQANEDLIWKWQMWFEAFQNGLIDEDGHVIPVVVTAMNSSEPDSEKGVGSVLHDMKSTGRNPGKSHDRVLDFGDYLSIVNLGTASINVHGSDQSRWLKKILRSRDDRPHVFPVYHAQAYPALRSTDGEMARKIKQVWTPLFDRYQVPMVFEFHEQLYKRTFPIRNDRITPEGTIYLGHGGWTTDSIPSDISDSDWYLDQVNHDRTIILIALHGDKRYIRTVNEFGQIIDEHPHLFEQPNFSNSISTILPKGGITLSAELAEPYGKVSIGSDHMGAAQDGFAWFDPTDEPAGLVWNVPSHSTNDYTMRFRYAHSGPEDANLQLLINGEVVENRFSFQATGSDSRWKQSTLINIVLQAGRNQIEIRAEEGELTPRIDRVEIFPAVF